MLGLLNARMLAEMLESIDNLQNRLKMQANTMGKQSVIDAEVLAGMLESIGNLQTLSKIQTTTMETQCVLMRGCWWRWWKN